MAIIEKYEEKDSYQMKVEVSTAFRLSGRKRFFLLAAG
jgi:hypothetical protein